MSCNYIFPMQGIGKIKRDFNFTNYFLILNFMKTNKKAILGMLVAMVMSLSIMNGMSKKQQDVNLQQVTAGAAYMAAGGSEGGPAAQATWGLVAAVGLDVTKDLAIATAADAWNPVGWACGVACGVSLL